jgi:plasmid maintenance system antidote protein VapI
MTSYEFDIGERPRTVSRFISNVRFELQGALIKEKKSRNLTQQAIAKLLSVNRSVINRQFMGTENLTLRSVADLAWALGYDVDFKLSKNEIEVGDNFGRAHKNIGPLVATTTPNMPKITNAFVADTQTAQTFVANTVSVR